MEDHKGLVQKGYQFGKEPCDKKGPIQCVNVQKNTEVEPQIGQS